MDLSNINQNSDPHNVQLLLSLLKDPAESSAESVTNQGGAASPSQPVPAAAATSAYPQSSDPRKRPASASHSSSPPGSSPVNASASASASALGASASASTSQPAPSAKPQQPARPDVSRLSAAQALPYLRRLASSATFLRALMTLKKEQDHLERALAREYAEMQAQGQADEGASKVEPEELAKWQDRALARWDLMLRRQQTRLQELHTPGFYSTTSRSARANQSQVLDLLSGLIDGA